MADCITLNFRVDLGSLAASENSLSELFQHCSNRFGLLSESQGAEFLVDLIGELKSKGEIKADSLGNLVFDLSFLEQSFCTLWASKCHVGHEQSFGEVGGRNSTLTPLGCSPVSPSAPSEEVGHG